MKFRAVRVGRASWWVGAWVVLVAGGSVATGEPSQTPLDRLRSGNERFVRAVSASAHPGPLRRPNADSPMAAVLSCADPGAPPEQIFDTAPGEIVSVRVGGPIADRVVVASLEHAVDRLKVPALVVMGHDVCSTIRAASASTSARGHGGDLIAEAIAPALTRAATRADLDARLAAVQATVEQTVNDLLRASESLRRHVRAGDVTLVGAYYEVESGRVVFSRPVDRVSTGAAEVTATR